MMAWGATQGATTGPWFLGEWHIASFKMPGTAALDSSEAWTWMGKSVRISSKIFTFDTDTCTPVEYETRHRDAIEYFTSIYRISPFDLGLKAQQLEVTDIRCGSRVAQSLVSADGKSLMIDFNGVFFTLARGKGVPYKPPVELSPEERLIKAHKQAKALYRAGDKRKAVEVMADGAGGPPYNVDESNVAIYEDYGIFLIDDGQYQTASDVLSFVLATFPDRTQSYLYLGDANVGLKNQEQAHICYLHYAEMMEQAGKKKLVPARVYKAIE
jgi:tetratricopeptide (TPR) repeat protein